MNELLASGIFILCVLGLMALDLGVFNRRAHRITMREAVAWSIFWISLSLIFNLGIFLIQGREAGLQFLTVYLLEKSLSLDNLFVFTLIFGYMAVPAEVQHKVLAWGILGALLLRGTMIAAGVALVSHFHWILYVFGAFLLLSGVRLLVRKQETIEPGRNPVVRLARKIFKVTDHYCGDAFLVRRDGGMWITPLLLVLLIIETTDVVFAVDSIPAVFAVTEDPFIVFTSNILAILGLRALYFVLAGALRRFRFLRAGLSVLLILVGLKMLLSHFYKLPTGFSFVIVVVVLSATALLSVLLRQKENGEAPPQS